FIEVRLPLVDGNQKDFCKDRSDVSRIEQSSCASQHGKLCSLRIQFQKVDARHARLRAESIESFRLDLNGGGRLNEFTPELFAQCVRGQQGVGRSADVGMQSGVSGSI